MTDRPSDRRWHWASLLAVAMVFSDAWLGTGVFYERDLIGCWYPQVEVVRRLASQGIPPWWNPFVAFGAPLLADPSLQLAYPPTWLVLLMPPAVYLKLYVVGHCCLAAVGARRLVRELGGSRVAAAIGGLAYACSGPLLSSVSLYHHFAGAAWMPVVIRGLLVACRTRTLAAALRFGAALAFQALAGSADLCFMTVLAGLLLVAFVGDPREPGRWGSLLRVAGLAVPFAAALAAVQWLPALALLGDSPRSGMTSATSLYWSMHPVRLLDALVPRLLSDLPLGDAARAALFESREPLLVSLYLGVPATMLAAVGVAGGAAWGRRLGLVFGFFVLLSAGRHAPLLPLLLRLPLFGLFRYPEKYMLPAALLFAILVARGADAWLGSWDAPARRRASGVALGVLLLALAAVLLAVSARLVPGHFSGMLDAAVPVLHLASAPAIRRLQVSALAFLVSGLLLLVRERTGRARPTLMMIGLAVGVDLVAAGRAVNALAPATLLSYRPPVLGALGDDTGSARVFSYPEPLSWLNRQLREGRRGHPGLAWALGGLDRLDAPGSARFGVRGSYDGDFTGFASPRLYAMGTILRRYEATPLGARLLEMGNVGHVVASRPEAFGLSAVASFPSVFGPPVRSFRVPGALPPAYVVEGIHVAAEPHSFEVMAAPAFDPRREAIVAGGLAEQVPTGAFDAAAQLLSRRPHRVVVDARLSAPGLLVLVEAWARGWSVEVDGKPAPLLRANVLFQGVALPGGRHSVTFSYSPPLLAAGASASLVAVLLGALAAIRPRRGTSGVEGRDPER